MDYSWSKMQCSVWSYSWQTTLPYELTKMVTSSKRCSCDDIMRLCCGWFFAAVTEHPALMWVLAEIYKPLWGPLSTYTGKHRPPLPAYVSSVDVNTSRVSVPTPRCPAWVERTAWNVQATCFDWKWDEHSCSGCYTVDWHSLCVTHIRLNPL